MDLELNNSLAKLPLLKQGEYDTWRLRIESYIQLQDYSLWEIIEEGNTFQSQYSNRERQCSESLDSIFNRLQKIVSQLTILGEIINPEELNLKFLRSLPTEWGHSSTNDGNTANVHVSIGSSPVSTASTNNSIACLSDATLALLSVKARKFYQRTGKKIIINGCVTAGYDEKKVECFNCHKLGHFAKECRNPKSRENRSRNQDSSRRTVNVEEASPKAMLAIDDTGFDWSYMAQEEASTNFALMAFSDSEQGINVVKPTAYSAWRPKVKNDKSCLQEYWILCLVLNSSYFMVKSWLGQDQTVLGQTAIGKESLNPFMAGSLPKTISPMIHISQEVILLKEERTVEFFEGWKPLSPLQLAVEEVMSEWLE
ncbi:ribonuclease H-like domain-containing protein [Tanacetum coccineum]